MNWPLIAAVAFLVLVYTAFVVFAVMAFQLNRRIQKALRPKDRDEHRRR